MSFKPEVRTGSDPKFYNNNLAFATREEAEISARDLMNRWLLVAEYRVAESDQPVNYQIIDGVMSEVPKAAAIETVKESPPITRHRP